MSTARTVDLDEVLKVGKIYRYIGNGEFETVDIVALVKKALERSLNEHRND